ncbi:iron-containing alcohol dehydrogenase [Frigidibacter sp. MR17.14]|uniref:iron-containing alcohol dehydrogenase n=1 Tax=Frigidibacter sp. MR17.14 TaxID=3126509 RepID=UPI003012BF63
MTPFGLSLPPRILFGRGEAAKAAGLAAGFGPRGLVVHGADPARAGWLLADLRGAGCTVLALPAAGEPDLAMLEAAVTTARDFAPDWVLAIGGGAALDLGKAVAALVPAPGGAMDHLEVVGRGLPLAAAPLPFLALPTTAGTGAEATKNAVIGLPAHGRKVSLRDDRMLARVAIVDPGLTDGCPRGVTLASGLDALAQVIEPYVSSRATPFTDALTLPAIAQGLAALTRLMQGEDPAARDAMAWVSLSGGIALANAGLGAVHGLAGPIGGVTGAAHGAICGVLLGPVLSANRASAPRGSQAANRLDKVCEIIGAGLGCDPETAPGALADWAAKAGLPRLTALGLDPDRRPEIAASALGSSSMRGNPVPMGVPDLVAVMAAAG